ncbi:unnamed protein product [Parajaminaea phylloscopi]
MDPLLRPTSARYETTPEAGPSMIPHSAINMGAQTASSSSSTPTSISARRRHSNSLTDDGLTEDRIDDLEGHGKTYDEGEDAMEMDTFLPHSRHREGDEAGEDKRGIADDERSDDPLLLVKRAVPESDDPTLPALTFRAVVIGSFFSALGASVAQLFFYKSNSPGFSAYFVILISLPLGRWMAKNLPDVTVRLPLIGAFSLNPGDFSIKEHLLIAIIASSGATSAYASDILNIQVLFFNQRMNAISSLTLLLTTQLLGFGFAGLVHNLLVKTPTMIFPWTLVSTSLFHTLHGKESVDMRKRLRFFVLAFLGVFCYQFLPALMAPTLSSIAVLCMFGNGNETMRILGSGYKGLGLLNFSFDWTAAGTSGPLFQPWWAALNYYTGFGLMMWIIMPVLYFVINFWDAQSFPSILGSTLFTATKPRKKFDVASVLRPDNMLDWDKWEKEGPIRLTPYFALSYGISFAILTSMLTHVFLWHWKDIKRALWSKQIQYDDYHNRAMRNYEEVPRSWYLTTLLVSLGAATILVAFAPLQLPVWGLFMSVAIALVFLVPVGIIKAVSDTGVGLNVITEFIAGYVLPGRPIANVTIKCLGYMSMSQALNLVADMKLAMYMKIPPKHMFAAQMLGTVIGCVVNYIVLSFVLSPASGYLPYLSGEVEDPTGQWDGRKVHLFYSASIIWGAIGPATFFQGSYRTLYWGFFLGAVAPIPFYLVQKRFGPQLSKRGLDLSKVAFPIFLHGCNESPQVPTNILISGFAASYLSQKWAREKRPKWFAKYNYVLSAALDAGTSINALVVFGLSVTVLKVVPMPHWWLNPAKDAEYCTAT